jgi:hypothetical protein
MWDLNLVPEHVRAEYSVRKIEAMLLWVQFVYGRGGSIPYHCRWWLPEFSAVLRIHTFRNCMDFFVKLVETIGRGL